MNGKQLFNKYLDAADKPGSPADTYAQLLLTISASIGPEIYPLLEQAEKEGKRLAIKEEPEFSDGILLTDILFI